MTQPGTNDWKTPLGYYERAIAELRKAREEFQTELKNLKENQISPDELQKLKDDLEETNKCLKTTQKTANESQDRAAKAEKAANDSQTELQNLKAEFQSYKIELQNLKEELQKTNKCLETTWKTANDFQDIVANAERTANNSRRELQNLKANLQSLRLESGVFSGNVKITPGWKGVLCCDRKGSDRFIRKYIRFSQPFSRPPKIVLGISHLDCIKTDDHRIKVIATDIDSHGFFLEIHTWLDTQVWGADVNWLAYSD